jgi:hypothetical protein
MRVKSKWHKDAVKTVDEIASALAFNTWRITKNNLEDLINEGFTIEKNQVFGVISEYLCFLIQCVDRLIFQKTSLDNRRQILILLARQSADYFHEEKTERIGEGSHWDDFVNLYNSRAQDYSEFRFNLDGPDYHFLRYFAEKTKSVMTQLDEKWVVQQMIEIQAPKAFDEINKSVENLMQVKEIISKEEKEKRKSEKIPRSKRKS